MPVALAVSTDQLVETSSIPPVITGVITQVVCAPFDLYGSLFKGTWREERWLPFELGAYIHVTPDEGDQIIVPIKMTNFGGLQWAIAATADVDPSANSSDIQYPGSPVAPNGLDMEAMTEAMEALWNQNNSEVKPYQQALIDKYGGEQPFSIGTSGLPKRTDWEFFLDMAQKITAWKDAVGARSTPPKNPHQLLQGFRGTLERLEMPQLGKKPAMQQPAKKPWKVHVPTAFDGYVDVGRMAVTVATTTAATATTTAATTTATANVVGSITGGESAHAKAFSDALIVALADSGGTLDKDAIRGVALSFGDDPALRKYAIQHRTDDEFLSLVEGTNWDGANLTFG